MLPRGTVGRESHTEEQGQGLTGRFGGGGSRPLEAALPSGVDLLLAVGIPRAVAAARGRNSAAGSCSEPPGGGSGAGGGGRYP